MADVALTAAPIDPRAVEALVARPGAGAIVTFLGVTRDHTDGRPIEWLEYEAFEAMAVPALRALVDGVAERWPGATAAIAHRTGRVDIGQASVVIAVSAAHRAAAFEACRWVIDTLKTTVPIWKKDVWAGGGASAWVAGSVMRSTPGPDGSGVAAE
ncbi:MAG: molybdenum cofactor biosynthesis protein MoaE [Ardenticatenales bacterium]